MKILKALTITLALGIAVISCTKEKKDEVANTSKSGNSSDSSEAIQGTYRVNFEKMAALFGDRFPEGLEQYIYVEKDSIILITRFEQDIRYGFKHALDSNSYVDNDDSKVILKKKGAELFFIDPTNQGIFLFAIETTLPERNSLLKFIRLQEEITQPTGSFPNYRANMAALGQKMYFVFDRQEGEGLYLTSINHITKQITDEAVLSLKGDNFPIGGICAANGSLWIAASNHLEKVDPATGISSFESVKFGTDPYQELAGLAFDGTNIYVAINREPTGPDEVNADLYRYSIASNTATKIQTISYPVNGMDYVNGKLIITNANSINECTVSPFKVTRSWAVDQEHLANIMGITHFGNETWVFLFPYGGRPNTFGKIVLN
ncbi:MAG: hypothetical protein V4616_12065 [Bacteroidota bacterium]